jgi:hypothetical protein
MAVPMSAATMPTTMVSQIGIFCRPGRTSRPSAPMTRPMMMAPKMVWMVMGACSWSWVGRARRSVA